VKEPSKNHDIWVRGLFGSWQNLGSGLVRSCWVGFFPISTFNEQSNARRTPVESKSNRSCNRFINGPLDQTTDSPNGRWCSRTLSLSYWLFHATQTESA